MSIGILEMISIFLMVLIGSFFWRTMTLKLGPDSQIGRAMAYILG